MKKYVVRIKENNGYIWNIFITPDDKFEGMILPVTVNQKKLAMTCKNKYMADAIARALDGEVEEV